MDGSAAVIPRAVVTGGAGFVGATLVGELVRAGTEVLVVDDLCRGALANLERTGGGAAEVFRHDIREAEPLKEAFAAFEPDVVFHLAAQIDVRVSMSEPFRDAGVNVLGSINVFSAAAATGVRRVVNTSTGGAVYGAGVPVPTPETAETAPESAYGTSKLAAESYAEWFRRAEGLDVLTLRYGNVYGPGQDPRGEAGVVGIFCDRLLAGQRPVIFGDGAQTRDFVYVRDVAAANLAAAVAPGPRHRLYNVGSGRETSVRELARRIAAVLGSDLTPDFREARAGEVRRSCLDVSRAHADLGLAPALPLDEGLRDTVAWIRSLR
ncbi:NAD-dependent epimerase/dehydratase family protein [Pseudonocardia pini]|uniref:NAD-dependent epimerase/dehydratase family protein n=1 Tax=Pseudonocardia pini TaxID=2758030 RepID=UPI0015F09B98|nr:NAD-dependent epimerase/dehydratase family protein [Pseudonocardia pini]